MSSPEVVVVCCAFFVFTCGTMGVVFRKNPMAVLMSIELMINAAILVLILGSRVHNNPEGQAAVVLVLGAAEVVVGLALALAVFRTRTRVDVDAPAEIAG